jgi:hypothetical protein
MMKAVSSDCYIALKVGVGNGCSMLRKKPTYAIKEAFPRGFDFSTSSDV